MKRILIMLASMSAGLYVQAQCCGSSAPASVSVAMPEAERKLAGGLPALVDLGAKKCIPCKKMAPILDELTTEFDGVMKVIFIDVWEKENVEKAKAYKIRTIPTQIFFNGGGKELFRHEGYISKADILARWKTLGFDMEELKRLKK